LSCIVTITRPNGASRSYTSPSGFQSKNEAKETAAKVAIENGALTFVVQGDKSGRNPRLFLAPLDFSGNVVSKLDKSTVARDESGPLHPDVAEINEYCTTERSDLQPFWLSYSEPNKEDSMFRVLPFKLYPQHFPAFGCILRIQLSKHVMRVYSVPATYSEPALAKAAVAQIAKKQNVFDFIKTGDGGHSIRPENHTDPDPGQPSSSRLTLQEFLDSLPSPIPDARPGAKTVADINPLGIINDSIQKARGTGLTSAFSWIPASQGATKHRKASSSCGLLD
jgi:hypothetical protein